MQNSAINVIALASHIESNTFYFLSLSWPILLYLSPQLSACLRVTTVSRTIVSPKLAVIATEKVHLTLTLSLAFSSAQHCSSFVPPNVYVTAQQIGSGR